jgi:uncharacterized small protein (DUF1192 family)
MMKKIWLGIAVIACAATSLFPEIAPEMLGVAVFLSIFGLAAGMELSERIYKLEDEVESLKEQLKDSTPS